MAIRIAINLCDIGITVQKENGLPHQCAHWFAMTCGNERGSFCVWVLTKMPFYGYNTRVISQKL